ncbi:MAG: hypothetical protein ACYDCL_08640 [Myxococcales bacterium]
MAQSFARWISLASSALAFTAAGCGVGALDRDSSGSLPAVSSDALSSRADVLDVQEPPMLGKHFAKDAKPHRSSGSPLMTFHGGAVLATAATEAIFWGTSWSSSSFVGDKIGGLDSWYEGHGGSHYAEASDEYTGTDGQVTSSTSYLGHQIDTSAAPSKAPSTSTILAEVCKQISSPVSNGYYAVYTDTPRGRASYCAWHSYGTCGGVPVQIGFFFDLDGDPGCDPQDTVTGHSQGLAALANVTGHELSEARTDPASGGWYDSSGSENGDKCAWTFDVPFITLGNGTIWKIQGEWSNAAYTAGTGYPNLSGQDGCLSGQ